MIKFELEAADWSYTLIFQGSDSIRRSAISAEHGFQLVYIIYIIYSEAVPVVIPARRVSLSH